MKNTSMFPPVQVDDARYEPQAVVEVPPVTNMTLAQARKHLQPICDALNRLSDPTIAEDSGQELAMSVLTQDNYQVSIVWAEGVVRVDKSGEPLRTEHGTPYYLTKHLWCVRATKLKV